MKKYDTFYNDMIPGVERFDGSLQRFVRWVFLNFRLVQDIGMDFLFNDTYGLTMSENYRRP